MIYYKWRCRAYYKAIDNSALMTGREKLFKERPDLRWMKEEILTGAKEFRPSLTTAYSNASKAKRHCAPVRVRTKSRNMLMV